MKRLLIPLFFLILLGAGCSGCFGSGDDQAGSAPTASAIEQAFGEDDSTFGNAATSSDNILVEPKTWDVDHVYSKHLAFDPPSGYWVYLSEVEHTYWLVPGTPPEPGSEDPAGEIRETRVARMQPITFIPDSFPTWDRFQLTMAQFQCVEGSTEDNLVGCLDEPRNVITGKTVSGLPYEKFEIQAVRKKDQAPQGWRTFIVVRLGAANDHAVLFTIEDEQKGVGPALELAKSMWIDVGE
jgi:hypothetical protein